MPFHLLVASPLDKSPTQQTDVKNIKYCKVGVGWLLEWMKDFFSLKERVIRTVIKDKVLMDGSYKQNSTGDSAGISYVCSTYISTI